MARARKSNAPESTGRSGMDKRIGEGAIAMGAGLIEAATNIGRTATAGPTAPGWDYVRRFDACPAFCALAHRLSAHRRRAHRPLQLALCASRGRPISAADRRYRPRAIDARGGFGHPQRS